MQRALEGLTRSLAKELKKAIAVQLVYVAEGAEGQIESTLRFLLSPRSAYVSAQVIRIGLPVGPQRAPADWDRALAGKKVLVTGASRGIGASIVEVMAREGAQVICLDMPQAQPGLDQIAARLGGRAIALDIGADYAPQTLADAAQAQGGWDVVVHNAGITRDKTIANMKEHLWQMVVNVNLSAQERINDALMNPARSRPAAASSAFPPSPASPATWADQLCAVQTGVVGMVQSTPVPCRARRHHQRRGARFHRNPDDGGHTLRHSRSRSATQLDEPGRLPQDVAETVAWFASPRRAASTATSCACAAKA